MHVSKELLEGDLLRRTKYTQANAGADSSGGGGGNSGVDGGGGGGAGGVEVGGGDAGAAPQTVPLAGVTVSRGMPHLMLPQKSKSRSLGSLAGLSSRLT